jgi:hypothetical protein
MRHYRLMRLQTCRTVRGRRGRSCGPAEQTTGSPSRRPDWVADTRAALAREDIALVAVTAYPVDHSANLRLTEALAERDEVLS